MGDRDNIMVPKGTSNIPAIVSDATALEKNVERSAFMVQNLSTNPLFVLFGEGASSTVFHVVLKGGTGNDDGIGGLVQMSEGVIYTGKITVAGTTPRYTVLEL